MLGGRKVSALMLDLSGTVHVEDRLFLVSMRQSPKSGIGYSDFSSGKTAEVVGKPSKEFFKLGRTRTLHTLYMKSLNMNI